MTTTQESLASAVTDLGDVPFDADVPVDDVEYARIMRRIGIGEGETTVSAFNSSI